MRFVLLVWPILVIPLLANWPGLDIKPIAVRLGIGLTVIAGAVGGVSQVVWEWPDVTGRVIAVGITGGLVINGFTIWCAIGALLVAASSTRWRGALALAALVGGLVGVVLGVITTFYVGCYMLSDCL